MKTIWNACKRPLWYIAAIAMPIFLIGDFYWNKIPALLAGFDSIPDLFWWVFTTNGTILLPWLTYDIWKSIICDPDPETGATASPFPNFWGGGRYSGGPHSFVLMPTLAILALLFGAYRETMLSLLRVGFAVSWVIMMLVMVPMLIALLFKMSLPNKQGN